MSAPSNIVKLDERKAKVFLTALAIHDFVTIIFDGEQAKVFTKGIDLDKNALRIIQGTLDSLSEREQ